MAYLATKLGGGATVIGIDGVTQALDTFAQEQPQLGLVRQTPSPSATVPHVYYSNRNEEHDSPTTVLELLCGDFFALDPLEPRCDFIFDRASMVAIDPTLRQAYVNVLDERVLSLDDSDDGVIPTILLVALERTSGTDWDTQGPPFSLPLEEIVRYYPHDQWTVTLLEDKGELSANQDRPMISKYYQIRRKKSETQAATKDEL